jgi:hypothetical protein
MSSSTSSAELSSARTTESRGEPATPPPRLAALRRRAWSTRTRRMAWDATAKKWPRLFQDIRSCLASRMYASWTSAVVWRLW